MAVYLIFIFVAGIIQAVSIWKKRKDNPNNPLLSDPEYLIGNVPQDSGEDIQDE
jgi:hypothetical protein